ncbi:hypothetical protein WA026_007656 [Henosepilachna vigintioctopunctata]|uniref:Uncharacterized protein n=1 Tax=Henosepilachna vigintioctopunctata TaxID=420089 RepID=A0AAW1U2W2_9CUCU
MLSRIAKYFIFFLVMSIFLSNIGFTKTIDTTESITKNNSEANIKDVRNHTVLCSYVANGTKHEHECIPYSNPNVNSSKTSAKWKHYTKSFGTHLKTLYQRQGEGKTSNDF